jgi:hypothetical protein
MLTVHVPSCGRYNKGCRCPGCKEAHAIYARNYRRRCRHASATMLKAVCWCEAELGPVPAADVAAGRTWSCGREECHP